MKTISTISVFVSVLALAGLCGCASNSSSNSGSSTQTAQAPPPKPKKDKRPIEQRLTAGMTMDQVKAACGNPKNETMNSDGSATWVYNNAQNTFIPYYTLSGGKIHYVMIMFDTSGKVKSWNVSDTGM